MRIPAYVLLITSCLICRSMVFGTSIGFHVQTGFIENKGQVVDQLNHSCNNVKYLFTGNGFKMILKQNSWSYEFYTVNHQKRNKANGEENTSADDEFDLKDEIYFQSHRVDVLLLNANKNPVLIPEFPASDVRNYCNGTFALKGITSVHHYQQITYQNIYPHIDLEIKLEDPGFLKYSFIVNPGGDMSDIQLIYNGETSLSLSNGFLQMNTAFGYLQESAPVYFVNNKPVSIPGKFILDGNKISFSKIKFDPAETIVIDPQINYGTYYGGDSTDFSEDLLIDHDRNIVVCGRTASAANIATTGAYQSSYGGGNFDAYLLKFSPSFQLQWATYFGGTKVDYGWTIDFDHLNNIYLGGESMSDGLATPGAQQKKVDGAESDGLIAKFSPSGSLTWCRYYGGKNKDQILGIHIDKFNRVLVTGYTLSDDSIATPGSFQPVNGGKGDGFLAVMDSNGKMVWASYYGAGKDDRTHHVVTDQHGNIIFSGTALSTTGIATNGTFHPNHSGFLDAFLVKFTPSGQRVWGTYYGGNNDDRGREVDLDHNGNIVMCGYTQSDSGIATPDAFKTFFSPGYDSTGTLTNDAFLVKFDSNGHRIWGTYFGDYLTETARGLAINSNDDLFIAGTTFDPAHIAYGNSYQSQLGGVSDLFFAKFNTFGNLLWSSYFGGSADEVVGGYGQVIRGDDNNEIYLTGSTLSSDSIATPGALKASLTSNAYDIYIAKFSDKCFDRYESNNSFATASPISVIADTSFWGYYADIFPAGDKDFYRFKLLSPVSKITIKLVELPSNYDLYLFDSLKNQIAVSKKSGTSSEKIQLTNPVTGSYYLKVVGRKNTQFNDSLCYRLTIFTTGQGQRESMEVVTEERIRVYPNPASGFVTLKLDADTAENVMLRVSNVMGELLLQEPLSLREGESDFTFDVSAFPAGMYFVTVIDGGNRSTAKLLVE